MRRFLTLGVTAAVAIALLAGCETFFPGDDGGAGDVTPTEFGGFTNLDEAPGFGDPDFVSGYPEDPPYDDGMASHPSVAGAMKNGGAKFYLVRLVWGNLDDPDINATAPTDCPYTDWSGSITVDGGVLIVRRVIRFEPEDSIIRPRRGPRELRWISHTSPSFDGLLLQIIDVPDPRSKPAANTLTIATPLYNAVIPLADLDDYRELVVYDDCNKMSVIGDGFKHVHCPRGFLEGLWTAATDTSGTFEGTWIRDDGGLAGHLRGRYGMVDSTRVLYGKWITLSGDFGGLLRGTWAPDDDDDDDEGPDGVFRGEWYDASFTIAGFFKGHYCVRDEDGQGYFHGRWTRDCR